MVVAVTVLVAAFAFVEAVRDDAPISALIGAGVLLVVGVPATRSLYLTSPRRSRVELWPDALVIHQPSLLKEPVRIPRGDVRAMTVDDGNDQTSFTPHRPHDRFLVSGDFAWAAPTTDPEAIGWLFVRSSGSLLPYCGSTHRTPNIAIVIDRTVTPRLRRRWVVNVDQRGLFPRLDRPWTGTLLETPDPSGANAALSAWGPVRQLVEGDFARPTDPRRQRTGEHAFAHIGEGTPSTIDTRGRATVAIALVGAIIVVIALAAIAAVTAGAILIAHMMIPLGLLAILLGGAVGLTLIPPRVDTGPQGIRMDPLRHPRLISAVERTAAEMNVPMPDEVLVTADYEASMSTTRGRRILRLGLPLLASLDERELVGVVTHEFAHARGDDTCIWRTVVRLDALLIRWSSGRAGPATRNPARIVMTALHGWFVRQTGPMLQANEFAADAAAATVVGSRRVVETLSRFAGLEVAYDIFWHSEFGPALRHGRRPPLAPGFHRFCRQSATQTIIAELGIRRLRVESRDAGLTHPTLRDRLTAVRALRAPDGGSDGGPALTLLGDTDPIETGLLETILTRDVLRQTVPIAWEDVVRDVHLPDWREHFVRLRTRLSGLTVGDLPMLAADPAGFAVRLGARDGSALRRDDARRGAAWTIGAALAVALADDGFRLTGEPGGPVTASRDRTRIRPFESAEALIDGTLDAEEWQRTSTAHGVAHLPLTPLTDEAPTVA